MTWGDRLIRRCSRYTFGVFLLHCPIIIEIEKYFPASDSIIYILGVTIVTIAISGCVFFLVECFNNRMSKLIFRS